MKKMLNCLLILIVLIIMVSCNESTSMTTTSLVLNHTSSLMTEPQLTESPTTHLWTTTIPSTHQTTQVPTTLHPTTHGPTTVEDMDPSIELNYVYSGSGTITNPYNIEIEEGQSTTYQIQITPDNAEVTYQIGQIDDGVFQVSNEEESGLTLNGSNIMFFSIQAIIAGEYCVKISANDSVSIYVSINVTEIPVDFTKRLKVLAIGNSFSVDGMEYLYKIADSWGVEEIVLGNLYIGGASLAMHVDSIQNNRNNYVYYKNNNDHWAYHNTQASVLDGLVDEDWDIISIQQVSGLSGVPSTYNSDLDFLINYINENKTNDRAKIVWHMTWAYQSDSTHGSFPTYNSNQLDMYHAITSTVQSEILTRDTIEYVIPSGTSIQNLRTSFIGDTLTRDGFHLDMGIGRYTASLTWFKMITGLSLNFVVFYPDDMTLDEFKAVKEAVNHAVAHPFVITESIYE